MVSGFNTEISHDGTVYHVQTESRKQGGIETSVYVKGAVIHSLRTSHPDLLSASQYSEQQFHQLLEDQHRRVISEIRAGNIEFPPAHSSGAGGPK
ncbi:MAG TPA: hypothetical protein VMW54_06420 [Terriglobia bacterium]|nr:hypothetical protein [Terriglobia bacterium]